MLRSLKQYRWVAAMLIASLLCGGGVAVRLARADSESSITDQQINQLLTNLKADRSAVREDALAQLKGLHRSELPALRRVISARMPLPPGEREVIHAIVQQIYLAEEPYEHDETRGFLGIIFSNGQQTAFPNGGIEVQQRIPGLSASRYLEDGDIVLSISGPGANADIYGSADLTKTIGLFHANAVLNFKVMRRGRVLSVPVTLSAIPMVLEQPTPEMAMAQLPGFVNARQAQADLYWNETFAPLFDPASAVHASVR